jgi:uncharacterized delta-60 repeat protein
MNVFCLLRGPVTAVTVSLSAALFCTMSLHAQTPLDASFNASLNGSVASIALQPDGKVILGGGFTTVNGAAKSYLARLNADGSLDHSFAPTNPPAQFVSHVLVVNSKIYAVAGDGLRRFNASGALEWHYPMSVATFVVDSQQRVVLGGQFTRVEGQYHRNIARLTASGALDSAFTATIGCCAGEGVDALAIQGDAVLVGGLFQSVNGTQVVSHFARITSGGVADTTFNAAATPRVLAIVAGPDGKILRVSEQALVRHLADGAADPGFAPVSSGGSSDDRFVTVGTGTDGKPIVGGNFTMDNGATRSYVARFNGDGSLDTSFSVSPNGQVNAIAVQADGGVLLGGWFTEINGSARVGIARIQSQAAMPSLNIAAGADGNVVISWPQSGAGRLESTTLNTTTWTAVAETPIAINGQNFVTNTAAGNGQLFRLRSL